jgi:hypothetical protein
MIRSSPSRRILEILSVIGVYSSMHVATGFAGRDWMMLDYLPEDEL